MGKKTNPLGPGTVNLAINMPQNLRDRIEAIADKNNMKMSEYCRVILIDAIERGVCVSYHTTLSAEKA